jgi:hypothetical protein
MVRLSGASGDITSALNDSATAFADLGLGSGLHQHTGTAVDTRDEVYTVMNSATHMHLKDFKGWGFYAGYSPLGQGQVDIPAILDMVEAGKQEWDIMVELDASRNGPQTPLETVQTSKAYLQRIATVFADEGADVAVNDIASAPATENVAAQIRGAGRITVKADVARRDEVEAVINRVWEELGPIDVLVNNAGIETIVPFLDLTDEQWTRLTDVNLRGGWLCSQVYCRRVVTEKRKGNIVMIGSIQAGKVLPGRTHYASTKLGLEALTRNMSRR